MLAPVILFTYDRPWHTEQTLQALMNNYLSEESVLYIYCDGVKDEASQEARKKTEDVRRVVRQKQWCKEIQIIERERNYGLARSIIDGVSEVLNKHGKAIILEDDLVPYPQFLTFMNDGLSRFENNEKVAGISGWSYNISIEEDFYFSSVGSCWGWATWSRVWKQANFDATYWIDNLRANKMVYKFDVDASYPFYAMLKEQSAGNVNSWAVCFYAGYFAQQELFLFPKKSLIKNIGEDGSGTHSASQSLNVIEDEGASTDQLKLQYNFEISDKIPVVEKPVVRKKIVKLLRTENSLSSRNILKNQVYRLMNIYSKHHI